MGAFVAFGFPVVGVPCLLVAWRQPVTGLARGRVEGLATAVFAALVVVSAGIRLSAPLSVWMDLVGGLPLLPCMYAAVRVWHA